MPVRPFLLTLGIAAVLVTGCDGPAAREPEAPFSPATTQYMAEAFTVGSGGVYNRSEPSAGVLTLARQGDQWRITIRAGGLPNGAATAADCELVAVGPFTEGLFVARLVPFEGELGGLDATDLGDAPPSLSVSIATDGVIVADDQNAAGRYCAAGSDIAGRYVKAG